MSDQRAAQGRVRVTASDVRHDCYTPHIEHPTYGSRRETFARWRCPECGTRWALQASFMDNNRLMWGRQGTASWRWRRAEARRREEALNG